MVMPLPKVSWAATLPLLVVVVLVGRAAGSAKSTVLASVEASLERCRATSSQHRSTLSTCTARAPSPCVCMCPTCLPEEWPHRKEPPPCTTPMPPPAPPAAPTAPPPVTGPPPPPLPALKVLPPYTADHLPVLAPFPETVTPTTTTLFPPPPPPGKCLYDGLYRGFGTYEEMGKGLCVDDGGLAISFKKRRELTKDNFECLCKEACDSEPACLGYSTNGNDDGFGLACRVYGRPFPTLVDRWLDLGSYSSPRFKGMKITGSDGEKGMTCYRRTTGEPNAKNGKAKGKGKGHKADGTMMEPDGANLLQMPEAANFMPVPPPPVSFAVRQTSTSELLVWQREQLLRCRDQQASLLSLIQQRGCLSLSFLTRGRQGRMSDLVMPNECSCHCPDCNFWQLPPPVCSEPTMPPTAPPPAPLPPGVIVVTGPPRAGTPPPMPVQVPLPPLPPIGDQFLPTLAPLPR